MTENIIKAELHAHLEGTLSPEMFQKLARANNIGIPDGLLNHDGNYKWDDQGDAAARLMSFVNAYDVATSVIKTPQDYFDITYDYLSRCAAENSIYEELTVYADPEPTVGISYAAMIDAMVDAIDVAREKLDIECRILPAFVRHYGVERSMADAKVVVSYPHKYITGITMAGAENMHQVSNFVPAYNLVTEKLGLQKTAHAGEATGPETIRACYELLGITRFGHMVRVVEDPNLMAQMADIGAIAEVCPSSNIALQVYPDLNHHPLRQMHDAGITITLNSDDPPFFGTTLGREYELGASHFGFTAAQLQGFTRNALNAAFVDEPTRQKLLKKCA